jgi:transcription initiation factor TFIIE subunit alpha
MDNSLKGRFVWLKKLQYEDSFVKVAGLLGGDEYIRVARALLNNENATDEEIASATGLKINVVRRVLYDLFGKSLITGIRVKDPKRGWYVYQWKAQTDQVDAFLNNKKKKILNRLRQRLAYERDHKFYFCGTQTCKKRTFDQAIDLSFRCPECGDELKDYDNSDDIKAIEWKIEELEKELKSSG